MSYKIPVYRPDLSGNEKKYVLKCLDSSWISSKGDFIPLFEKTFADYLGVKYAASVCNGTTALHVALLSLGIGKNDEVIVPTLSYISCANSIHYTGARPVFVDSLPDTWQINHREIEKKITSRTKAIMAVHLYGYPCDMKALKSICRKHRLLLIEDCAEAIGSKFNNEYVGTFGDIATFSFYGNKTITTGEGGMIATNNKAFFEKVVRLKGQGLAKGREYWHDIVGYNYRMTNICAAIGLAQFEQLEKFISKKRQVAQWYLEELRNEHVVFHSEKGNVFHTYWMCSILLRDSETMLGLRKFLVNSGVETRPLFHPIHTMPMYKVKNAQYKVAEDLSSRGINLPSYPSLTKTDVKFICYKIKEFFRHEDYSKSK